MANPDVVSSSPLNLVYILKKYNELINGNCYYFHHKKCLCLQFVSEFFLSTLRIRTGHSIIKTQIIVTVSHYTVLCVSKTVKKELNGNCWKFEVKLFKIKRVVVFFFTAVRNQLYRPDRAGCRHVGARRRQ